MAFIFLRMFAPVIGAAYTMTTKREAHWSEQTKAQNTEKGMYVGMSLIILRTVGVARNE